MWHINANKDLICDMFKCNTGKKEVGKDPIIDHPSYLPQLTKIAINHLCMGVIVNSSDQIYQFEPVLLSTLRKGR